MQQKSVCEEEQLKAYEDRLSKLKRSYDTFKRELADLPKRPAANDNEMQASNTVMQTSVEQSDSGNDAKTNSSGANTEAKTAGNKSTHTPVRDNTNASSG